MAVIQTTQANKGGAFTLVKNTLTASDSIVYVPGNGQILYLHNPNGSPSTPTIKGDGASAAYVIPGTGGSTINASSGKPITVAAGEAQMVYLDSLSAYLVGAVTITGGAGLTAYVINY